MHFLIRHKCPARSAVPFCESSIAHQFAIVYTARPDALLTPFAGIWELPLPIYSLSRLARTGKTATLKKTGQLLLSIPIFDQMDHGPMKSGGRQVKTFYTFARMHPGNGFAVIPPENIGIVRIKTLGFR